MAQETYADLRLLLRQQLGFATLPQLKLVSPGKMNRPAWMRTRTAELGSDRKAGEGPASLSTADVYLDGERIGESSNPAVPPVLLLRDAEVGKHLLLVRTGARPQLHLLILRKVLRASVHDQQKPNGE